MAAVAPAAVSSVAHAKFIVSVSPPDAIESTFKTSPIDGASKGNLYSLLTLPAISPAILIFEYHPAVSSKITPLDVSKYKLLLSVVTAAPAEVPALLYVICVSLPAAGTPPNERTPLPSVLNTSPLFPSSAGSVSVYAAPTASGVLISMYALLSASCNLTVAPTPACPEITSGFLSI